MKANQLATLIEATQAELDNAPNWRVGTPWWSDRIASLKALLAQEAAQ